MENRKWTEDDKRRSKDFIKTDIMDPVMQCTTLPSHSESLKRFKFQHFHTIKDDSAVSQLKFVRMGEDVQQYGLAIPATMLNNVILSG
ncbi:hypothetical protein Tco_1178577 [Tanacetum coccineum]